MKIPVTVLVLTKNEEKAITECLASVADFDQIIVIDSGSQDKTVELSERFGAEVINFSWNGKYPKKKQWGLENPQVRHDWVLFIDADERVTPSLAIEIRDFLSSNLREEFAAAEVKLDYHFLGSKLSHGHRAVKRALVNRILCKFPVIDDLAVSNMWEVEGHYQPETQGKIYQLKSRLVHLDPDPLFDYFARHNRYSDWEAFLINNEAIKSQVTNARTAKGKIFSSVPFKPLAFFFYSFVIRLGWLDGRRGFHFAIANSFYQWQIGLKAREMRQRRS
jgi:glycosyltransferase involved in cell wall biosynthesis